MALNVIKRETEAEREIGYRYLQLLSRAEALVPGAGREAIDVLLWDANAVIIRADVQNDRVVLDGTLNCQAVYRQGGETTLRALTAKANISQVAEIQGAQGGMLCRVHPVVESIDARYENGHMVFMVSLGVHVRVMKLEPLEVITGVEEGCGAECKYAQLELTRLAAEATETAVITERVELPRALDARTTLMDWGSVVIDSGEADLGGVRVKGRVAAETLVASGIEGRPAVQVKYPIEFDKLIELPEWLSRNTCIQPSVRSIRTQIEPPQADEEGVLMIQADVHFAISANLREEVKVLEDIYATAGCTIGTERERQNLCTQALCLRRQETVRGTVLLDEGAPAVGSVIAVRVLANIAESEASAAGTRIQGLLYADVLYMPAGGDIPAAAHTRLPFEIDIPEQIGENAALWITPVSAEANALMSDRLEMKIALQLECESRIQGSFDLVTEVSEGEAGERRPGYIICWPDDTDDAWSIGKRYGIASETVARSAGEGGVNPGRPLVLRV